MALLHAKWQIHLECYIFFIIGIKYYIQYDETFF